MKKKRTKSSRYTFFAEMFKPDKSQQYSNRQRLALQPVSVEDDATDDSANGKTDQSSFCLMGDRGFEAKVQGADPQTDPAVTSIDDENVSSWLGSWTMAGHKTSWI